MTHYVHDLGGNPVAEADGGTGAAAAEYVWLGGMPLTYIQGGAVYFVHPDHLGTPQRVTDATAAVVWDADYRPFGAATVSGALTFNLRFPGQYADAETGLRYNYFRDYDASTGRYIQSDPIGLQGGWNTYGYVGGNPIKFLDLLGLLPVCKTLYKDQDKSRTNRWHEWGLKKNYSSFTVLRAEWGVTVGADLDPLNPKKPPLGPEATFAVYWVTFHYYNQTHQYWEQRIDVYRKRCWDIVRDECGDRLLEWEYDWEDKWPAQLLIDEVLTGKYSTEGPVGRSSFPSPPVQ